MNSSRRSFLTGAFAATVYVSLLNVNSVNAEVSVGSKKEDKDLLKKMVRTHNADKERPVLQTKKRIPKKKVDMSTVFENKEVS